MTAFCIFFFNSELKEKSGKKEKKRNKKENIVVPPYPESKQNKRNFEFKMAGPLPTPKTVTATPPPLHCQDNHNIAKTTPNTATTQPMASTTITHFYNQTHTAKIKPIDKIKHETTTNTATKPPFQPQLTVTNKPTNKIKN